MKIYSIEKFGYDNMGCYGSDTVLVTEDYKRVTDYILDESFPDRLLIKVWENGKVAKEFSVSAMHNNNNNKGDENEEV